MRISVTNLGRMAILGWCIVSFHAVSSAIAFGQTNSEGPDFPMVTSTSIGNPHGDDLPPPKPPGQREQQDQRAQHSGLSANSANRQPRNDAAPAGDHTTSVVARQRPTNGPSDFTNQGRDSSQPRNYDPHAYHGATQASYQDSGSGNQRYPGGYQNYQGAPQYSANSSSGSGGWKPFGGIFSRATSRTPSSARRGGDAPLYGAPEAGATPQGILASQPHDPIVRPEAVYLDAEPVTPGPRAGNRQMNARPTMAPTSLSAAPMPSTRTIQEMELPPPDAHSTMMPGNGPMVHDGVPPDGESVMDGGTIMEDDGAGMMMDHGSDGFTNPYCNDCHCGSGGGGDCGGGCMGGYCNRGGCGNDGCCDDCDDECCAPPGGHAPYGRPWVLAPLDWVGDQLHDPCTGWWWGESLTVFAGAHNYRNPVDLGINSNFGFQEGLNTAVPLCNQFDIGWQFGLEATQSDLDSTTILDQHRNQFFITTGLFHKAPCCGGLELGAVFDWLHDDFYQDFDVGQVRGNIGYWWDCCNELGCDASVGVINDKSVAEARPIGAREYDVINQYFFYWGRRLACGGLGKIGGGFTSNDGGLVGAEFNVPVSKALAVEGGFTYLISDKTTDQIPAETWNLGINLVWYPGCTARCGCLPFRPLFDVADNGSLMVTRHGVQQPTPPQ